MKIILFFLTFTSIIYTQAQDVSVINNIKTDEIVSIRYQSNGCFGSTKNVITLTKTEDDYLLIYQKKEYHLSDKDFKILLNFEDKLHHNHHGGCTTIDDYEIINTTTSEFYSASDTTCSWNGFVKLIKKLKLKK